MRLAGVAALLPLVALAQPATRQGTGDRRTMTFADARPVLDALGPNLPLDLKDKTPDAMATAWPAWISKRNSDIRSRVARGDDDSVVNFWLYGTSFTAQPRAVTADDSILRARIDDFIAAVRTPGSDERRLFAAGVLARHKLDASSASGREGTRRFLLEAHRRITGEFAATDKALAAVKASNQRGDQAAAYGSIFRERGLSTDTSILADYGVSGALSAIAAGGQLTPGSVRRVAVIGPGLDFTNKSDGYDFYPQQTIQPFALADTLRRLGLAADGLRVTTFDLSARVNAHLVSAVNRARSGSDYVLTLPLDRGGAWTDSLVAFWKQLGGTIGQPRSPSAPPAAAGDVQARAIAVRPAIVQSISPIDLNIVVERLDLPSVDRFDLIVATNVLVYYDVFEQALALANAAAMLRPGGVFLSNTAVFPTPPMNASAGYLRVSSSAKQYDDLFWYTRER